MDSLVQDVALERIAAAAEAARVREPRRERLSIVIGGHVDHGKSTIIGRLLADTNSLPAGKLAEIRRLCERTAKPFEYAFLLDALSDERAQGITIDSARVFFSTAARDYLILDTPGHIEFLKNMVTGAARAEAALLVIDAAEGIQENSRRHGYVMSMLGLRQVAVVVNKMDLVGYSAEVFARIEREYRTFLRTVRLEPACFIPVSGREGDNVATRSARLAWHAGPTVLESLDRFTADRPDAAQPFRMPVQDVYKFTSRNDDRRIVAGTVATGSARAGDEVVFYPSGKRAVIRRFEAFNRTPPDRATAGQAIGFTFEDQIYIARGELAARTGEPAPEVSVRVRANLFWLGGAPLETKKDYTLKLGAARAPMRVEEIHRIIDASSLRLTPAQTRVERHQIAECTLTCARAIAFDRADRLAATSRFVVVDNYEICGGGIIREALPDQQAWVREKVMLRNAKWEPSFIPSDRRATRFAQRATLLIVTGAKDEDRKGLAKLLEATLFDEERVVYFLGIANVVYGVDADLAPSTGQSA